MTRIPTRCTCHRGFNWEDGPCDFCMGQYPCPGGCGEDASDCICDEKDDDDE